MRPLAAPVLALAVLAVTPARAEVAADVPPPTPWLGISFEPDGVGGAHVSEVHPGTAASEAGLQPDDDIIALGGIPVGPDGSPLDLPSVVRSLRVGDKLPITFVRGDRSHTVVARLTAKPTTEEIVYQRLIDRVPPAVTPYDRDGRPIPTAERGRRPQVWAVFDVHCDRCAAEAAALATSLDDAALAGAPRIAMRSVLVGRAEEADAYLARVPVVGTVWRMDRDEPMEDAMYTSYGWRSQPLGRRYLSGMDIANDGVVMVLDDKGVVRFATALSVGEAAHDGACAAAARFARTWRR